MKNTHWIDIKPRKEGFKVRVKNNGIEITYFKIKGNGVWLRGRRKLLTVNNILSMLINLGYEKNNLWKRMYKK